MVVSEFYLDRLNLVAQASPSFRQRAVQTLYGRGSTIESKNRALRDIYHLFKGDWSEQLEWRFTKINDLVKQDDNERPPAQIDEENWSKLLDEIDQAKQKTYVDFEDLKNQLPVFNDGQEYMDWFLLYLPYLVLDLQPNPEGWKAARSRLDWFLEQVPVDEGCPVEILEDLALLHMDSWYV